ncbi:unnamed protein product [Cylindrotheca closterium]|uniref:Uncharacterized protein n=1 Tax=Cylindrotheca closterium TaxID=2856 RepID=A0AAD2JN00_9STRA|nr:unnamed protein product [Cylindrotheca closterium]
MFKSVFFILSMIAVMVTAADKEVTLSTVQTRKLQTVAPVVMVPIAVPVMVPVVITPHPTPHPTPGKGKGGKGKGGKGKGAKMAKRSYESSSSRGHRLYYSSSRRHQVR